MPYANGTSIRPGVMGFNPMYPMMSMDGNSTSTYALSPYTYMPQLPPPPPPPIYQHPMYYAEYNPEMEPEAHENEVDEL